MLNASTNISTNNQTKEKPVCLSPRQFAEVLATMAHQEKLGYTHSVKKEDIEKEAHGMVFSGRAWEFVMLKFKDGTPCPRRHIRIEWIKTPCVIPVMKGGNMVYEAIPGKEKIEMESFIWSADEENFVQIKQHAALKHA